MTTEQEIMPLDLNLMEDEELFDEEIFEKVSEKAGIEEVIYAPPGQYKCTVTKVEGISIIPYFTPPCPGVKIILTVDYATKIYKDGSTKRTSIDMETGKKFAGQLIIDKFGLFVNGENIKNKEKRAALAKEFKLVKPGEPVKPSIWMKLEGKSCLVDNAAQQKKNESGVWEDTGYTKVGLFGRHGYKYLDESPIVKKEPENVISDINVDDI